MQSVSPSALETIRIFISSPGDVSQERERASQVIESLRRRYARRFHLAPIFWENLPLEPDMSFQQGIDLFLENPGVHIAVFILWSRLGSPLGTDIRKADGTSYRSGTEREYDLMLQARAQSRVSEGVARPRMIVYTRRDDDGFDARLRGKSIAEKQELLRQKELVESFMQETFKDAETGSNIGAYHPFDRPVAFSQRLRTHLQAILDELAGDMDEVIWDIAKNGPPFVGLQAFQPEHANVFFGREEDIHEARNALRLKAGDGCAFLLLSGASGSGKSSLARAGILPEIIAHETDEKTDIWRSLILTPSELGEDSIVGLLDHLAGDGVLPELKESSTSLSELAGDLIESPQITFRHTIRKAIESASSRRGGGVRILLVIDQLEEIFTHDGFRETQRRHFLDIIETFARSGLFWVIATIRSDFYQQIKEPALLRMKEGRGMLDVLPPGTDALQRVIEEPARLAGLTFEAHNGQSLSSRILKDAAPYAELLPLLEFVLTELYHHRTDHQLTFASYESLGGVEGALATTAEKTFLSLSPAAQQSLGAVLQSLVTLGDEGKETGMEKPVRQHAPLSAFGDDTVARQLIDAFVTARLFTAINVNDEATVTLAHESLLRVWPRAVKWREDDIDFLRTRSRIAARLKEGSPLLKGDPLLDTAKAFLATRADAFTGKQREYIQACVEAANAKELRAIKRRRAAFVLLRAAKNEAHDKNIEASRKAYGRAREALKVGEARSGFAYLAEALGYDEENRLARWDAIHRLTQSGSLYPLPIYGIFRHEEPIRSSSFSPDGTRVITVSKYNTVRIWDTASGEPVGEPLSAKSVAFNPSGTRVVTVSSGNTVRMWDISSGEPAGEPLKHEYSIHSISFSPDGTRVVTSSQDNTARIWDTTSGKLICEPLGHEHSVVGASFSPDGTRVVTASKDTALIWDASGKFLCKSLRHEHKIREILFSPDGTRIVTVSKDDTARIWDSASGELVNGPLSAASISFSPDRIRVVIAGYGFVEIRDIASGELVGERLGHIGSVVRASFSPDGTRVVTSESNVVRIWDVASGKPVGEPFRHEYSVIDASFSPDGTRVVTASENTALIWSAAHSKPIDKLLRHGNWVRSASFSPDGTRIVTASWDYTARIWDATSGSPLGESLKHKNVVLNASFSSDGTRVVTVSGGVREYCAAAGLLMDGTRVVNSRGDIYAKSDDTVRIWDATSGKLVGKLLRHEDHVIIIDPCRLK